MISKIKYFILIFIVFLEACSSCPENNLNSGVKDPFVFQFHLFQKKNRLESNEDKINYKLLNAKTLLNNGKYFQAAVELDSFFDHMNILQNQEFLLLKAQLDIFLLHREDAKKLLEKIQLNLLSNNQQIRYEKLKFLIFDPNTFLDIIRDNISKEPFLKGNDHQKNIDITWGGLIKLPLRIIENLVIETSEVTLRGWFDLIYVWRANIKNPKALEIAISEWRVRYPKHPVAKTFPSCFFNYLQNIKKPFTGVIALLLPFNNSMKIFSNAILKGIQDAKNAKIMGSTFISELHLSNYSQKSEIIRQKIIKNNSHLFDHVPVNLNFENHTKSDLLGFSGREEFSDQKIMKKNPSPSNISINDSNIKIYDTSRRPIQEILNLAEQDKAKIVIGPLLKDNVDNLYNVNTKLNIIALNNPKGKFGNNLNICYFSFSPDDEVRDAADHIWNQGKRYPLLVLPRNHFGDRVSRIFSKEWESLGGKVVLERRFSSEMDLKIAINRGESIPLRGVPVNNKSKESNNLKFNESRDFNLENIRSSSVKKTSNVDSVYIVSNQNELSLIKPMIVMHNSLNRRGVTFYASSHSFQSSDNLDFFVEMDGLQFSEIPFLSKQNFSLLKEAKKVFRNNYCLLRLYAMGVDAWLLANYLPQMHYIPGFTINGYTGDLSISKNCVIRRKHFSWSQYNQGKMFSFN